MTSILQFATYSINFKDNLGTSTLGMGFFTNFSKVLKSLFSGSLAFYINIFLLRLLEMASPKTCLKYIKSKLKIFCLTLFDSFLVLKYLTIRIVVQVFLMCRLFSISYLFSNPNYVQL